MNQVIKNFKNQISSLVSREKEIFSKKIDSMLNEYEGIYLECFSNDNPYVGELKNKIFFTYSDHYRGNSGTWIEEFFPAIAQKYGKNLRVTEDDFIFSKDDVDFIKGIDPNNFTGTDIYMHKSGIEIMHYWTRWQGEKDKWEKC